jgi:hypothetical protein
LSTGEAVTSSKESVTSAKSVIGFPTNKIAIPIAAADVNKILAVRTPEVLISLDDTCCSGSLAGKRGNGWFG